MEENEAQESAVTDKVEDIKNPLVPTAIDPNPQRGIGGAVGTPKGDALAFKARQDDRTGKQAFTDSFGQAGRAIKAAAQHAVDTIAATSEPWDREKHFTELVTGLNPDLWDKVLDSPTLEIAKQRKRNITREQDRLERSGFNSGIASNLAGFTGSLVDIDAPLVLLSGGSLGAAKVTGATVRAARFAGAGRRAQLGAAGLTTGASGGLQAGTLVGAGQAVASDNLDALDAIAIMLTATAFGSSLGVATPGTITNTKALREEFEKQVREGADSVFQSPKERFPDATNESGNIVVAKQRLDGAKKEKSETSRSASTADEDSGLVAKDENVTDVRKEQEGSIETATDNTTTTVNKIPAINQDSTVGALAVPGAKGHPELDVPIGISEAEIDIVQQSRLWDDDTGFSEQIAETGKTFIGKASMSKLFGIGTRDVLEFAKSKSKVLNRMAGSILELPGRQAAGDASTASILRDKFVGRINTPLINFDKAITEFAREKGETFISAGGGFIPKPKVREEFNKAVILELNSRRLGRNNTTLGTSKADTVVRAAADMIDEATAEAADILRGRVGELPVSGAENLKPREGHFPFRWRGGKIANLIAKGIVDEAPLIKDISKAIRGGGIVTDATVSDEIAKALITRFKTKGFGQSTNIIPLMTADGRAFIEETIRLSGANANDVTQIMRKFDSNIQDARKLGSLKSRTEVDLEAPIKLKDGSQIQVADLLDQDLESVLQNYSREAGGAAALARKGIQSKAEIETFIQAARKEQVALGETPLDSDVLRAFFSEFDGGPQVGFASGQSNRGIGAVAEIKSATSLSLLQTVGFAQMAETLVTTGAIGANRWWKRGIGTLFNNASAEQRRAILNETKVFLGEIGKDQHLFKPHRHFDEANDIAISDDVNSEIGRKTRDLISAGNFIQGFTSGLNFVKGKQQEIAVAGFADDVVDRVMKADSFPADSRLRRDYGVTPEMAEQIKELVNTGVIEQRTERGLLGEFTYLNRLNLDQWPGALAEDFTSSLARATSQAVQRALPGEHSRWMFTPLGSVGTHLITFPLLATQKQFFRNALSADKQAAITAAMGLASAYTAVRLRDVLTGREERTEAEYFRLAIGYSNVAGWVPLYSDPLMTALGLNSLRIEQFGPFAEPFEPPAASAANKLLQAPGDLFGDGELNRTLPFSQVLSVGVNLGSAPFRAIGIGDEKEEEKELEVPDQTQQKIDITGRVEDVLNNN